jgi:dephospho-CoA kinase
MMVIGLTGSIATGKSEVAKIFRTLNIPVFDADSAVHEIYENGTAAKALANICPDAIEGDKVDRKILSGMIAKNPALLNSITTVIHPLVQAAEQDFLKRQNTDMAVIDSPLILETGRARDMDLLVVVSSSPDNQRTRALARPGMTTEKLELIRSKQMPDDEKRAWADYVIENNGSLEELATTTRALIAHIRNKEEPHA